jgi:hypothetical protein
VKNKNEQVIQHTLRKLRSGFVWNDALLQHVSVLRCIRVFGTSFQLQSIYTTRVSWDVYQAAEMIKMDLALKPKKTQKVRYPTSFLS